MSDEPLSGSGAKGGKKITSSIAKVGVLQLAAKDRISCH